MTNPGKKKKQQKDHLLAFRISSADNAFLDMVTETTGVSKSRVIRASIRKFRELTSNKTIAVVKEKTDEAEATV